MPINEILMSEGLGELSDADVIHAYGVTSKGIRVWLPKTCKNEYWINAIFEPEGIIVQLGKKPSGNQRQLPTWEPAVVITRGNNTHEKLSGRYRPVFHNADIALTIHARETVNKEGAIFWVKEDFAATLEEAKTKADVYRKKAEENHAA